MKVQFQVCGLIILIVLLILYKSHRTLRLYKERVFFRALCAIILSLILDISSLLFIHFRTYISIHLVNIVCKVYVVSLIWASRSALVYVLTDIMEEIRHRKAASILLITGAVESLLVYLMPIYIYDDGLSVYTYGLSISFVYFFVVLYILATVYVAIHFRKQINPRRYFAVIIWMSVWIVAALIQFINKDLLIVGFASAVGMLVLYVVMENPEVNLDRELGCFNSYALNEYVNQIIGKGDNFSFLELYFEDDDTLSSDLYSTMRKILKFLDSYHNVEVFKNIGTSIVIVSHDTNILLKITEEMSKMLPYLERESHLIFNQYGDMLESGEDLYQFLAYTHAHVSFEERYVYYADFVFVKEYKNRRTVEDDIKKAIEQDRVEVFLQPIYSNLDNGFTSAEALMRIRREDGSLISPMAFIPVAEDSGQILVLGEMVFEKVCSFLKQTRNDNLGLHYIEINLSVVQCDQPNLAESLIEIARRHDINPEMINLEITETASIRSRNVLLSNMRRLIEYGFSFSLDDFGKGESNLMYIVDMPVSLVKLDKDMSKAFFTSIKAKQVVRAVVKMVHDMGLKLVAEGIETKDELDTMHQERIDYIQGYYYSKPLPMAEAVDFFKANLN
ncbi:MAG: EAL domain-containing protein [Erysipelotrichaceae bacterium]